MCRQRIDPEEWQAHGGHMPGEPAEWSERACGMAALRMIADQSPEHIRHR
jgi:hypothetical protein